jgi:hypothetical protein
MRTIHIAAALTLALVCAGCASTPRRTESMRPSKPPPGVTMWSDGAYEAEVDGVDRTVVHVGFLAQASAAEQPCERSIAIVDVRTDDRTIERPRRVAVSVNQREIQAIYVLPDGLDPQDVDTFDVSCGRGARTVRFVADEVNTYEPTNYAQRRFDLLFY